MSRVDLPHPEDPRMERNSPCSTERFIPRSTGSSTPPSMKERVTPRILIMEKNPPSKKR